MKSLLLSITAVLAIVFSSYAQPDSTGFSTFRDKISTKPDSARFEDLNNYGYDMIDLLKFARVASAVAEMMQLAVDKENRVWEGRTYMLMAWLQKVQSNSNAAVSNYQKAHALFQKAGEVRREIRALQRIGAVYITVNDLKLAEHYFRRGLSLAEKSKMEDEVANMYTDFATVEDIRKNYNGALAYNDKALKIYKKLGADFSSTLFNRGIILKNAGRYQESLNTYMQLLDYARKESDEFLEKMVYLNLPNTLLLLNRPDEAEQYVKKAIEMAKTSPQRINDYMHIYEMLTNIYKKKGEFEQALNYQNQWVAYRDSVFNSEKSRQLIEAETRFQAKENQERIQRLGTENYEKKRQLWWLYGGISMLAFLLAIALWQYRIIQRVNQKLEITNSNLSEANSRISVQATQLKELMQELHHRVKNNLAIVSSLLSLQASRLEDEKAIQAVTEGQQRVEAMSLIHQQLYQTDNVAGVSVKEYIQDLVKGLMQSFGYSEDFSLRTDIEPLVLDLKMAVPLGLIVNELITNAFKHAYKGIENPELSIRLWQQEEVYLEIKDNGKGVDV
uniref:sensor histidine kinase n=1 Tax=Dyadobacter sp. TaxID=1914288 RepID=UPI003F72780C